MQKKQQQQMLLAESCWLAQMHASGNPFLHLQQEQQYAMAAAAAAAGSGRLHRDSSHSSGSSGAPDKVLSRGLTLQSSLTESSGLVPDSAAAVAAARLPAAAWGKQQQQSDPFGSAAVGGDLWQQLIPEATQLVPDGGRNRSLSEADMPDLMSPFVQVQTAGPCKPALSAPTPPVEAGATTPTTAAAAAALHEGLLASLLGEAALPPSVRATSAPPPAIAAAAAAAASAGAAAGAASDAAAASAALHEDLLCSLLAEPAGMNRPGSAPPTAAAAAAAYAALDAQHHDLFASLLQEVAPTATGAAGHSAPMVAMGGFASSAGMAAGAAAAPGPEGLSSLALQHLDDAEMCALDEIERIIEQELLVSISMQQQGGQNAGLPGAAAGAQQPALQATLSAPADLGCGFSSMDQCLTAPVHNFQQQQQHLRHQQQQQQQAFAGSCAYGDYGTQLIPNVSSQAVRTHRAPVSGLAGQAVRTHVATPSSSLLSAPMFVVPPACQDQAEPDAQVVRTRAATPGPDAHAVRTHPSAATDQAARNNQAAFLMAKLKGLTAEYAALRQSLVEMQAI